MTERLGCCVPFCRRTTRRVEFAEWICGNHWRLVGKPQRQAYGRLMRHWRRYHRDTDGRRADRLWRRLKAIAIHRAMGL